MNAYYPLDFTTPYKLGWSHLNNGLKNKNVLESVLGVFELIPFYNYLPASNERLDRLSSPDKVMKERRLALKEELVSPGVIFQQLYFEVYNSDLPCIRPDSFSQVLGNSFLDRQRAVLTNLIKLFIQKKKQNPKELLEALEILEKVEPIACLITCLMLEPSKKKREDLKKRLIEELINQITSLKEGGIMLIPYGYANQDCHDLFVVTSPGHATLLEIRRIDQQKAYIRIFDTALSDYSLNASDRPWEKIVFFEPLTDSSFWENTIAGLMGKEASNENGYKQFEEIMIENSYSFSSKKYRKQKREINNCAKKSLQVWLHDRLQHKPKLYLKLRLFALDFYLEESKKLLPENRKSLWVDHAVCHWGGSDNVTNIWHNFYFKIRGFISGPKVKCSLTKNDLNMLCAHAKFVKMARAMRLESLQGKSEEAIKGIKELSTPTWHKAILLDHLKKFCIKHRINVAHKLFYLDEKSISELFSEKGLEEIQLNLTTQSCFGEKNYSMHAIRIIFSLGPTIGGIEKTALCMIQFSDSPIQDLIGLWKNNYSSLSLDEREWLENSIVDKIKHSVYKQQFFLEFAGALLIYGDQKTIGVIDDMLSILHKAGSLNHDCLEFLIDNHKNELALTWIKKVNAKDKAKSYLAFFKKTTNSGSLKRAVELWFPKILKSVQGCNILDATHIINTMQDIIKNSDFTSSVFLVEVALKISLISKRLGIEFANMIIEEKEREQTLEKIRCIND